MCQGFRDEMLPAETPFVVRPKTREVQVTFTEDTGGEMRTLSRESGSQFIQDLAVQWEIVLDSARKPWRWNMTEEQRNEWIRAKPIQSEYS